MKSAISNFQAVLKQFEQDGLTKNERVITTPQQSRVNTTKANGVTVLCANNYLGFANHPEIIQAAKDSYEQWGYGLSSVRFICGTQAIHKQLEDKLSAFLGMDDTILYSSCFDANGGLFETLLTDADAVISDELNHASIIDGIRLCKAKRLRYKNNDMAALEDCLKEAADARIRLIVTDGVFSMDGTVANLKGICDLADQYDALVMVDDSHAVGFVGEGGRGTPEHCGVMGRVDILTGTFGKALGGASGGYTSARRDIVALLRQKSRPYLFSNTLAPSIACGTIKALEIVERDSEPRERLRENTRYFRAGLKALGFDVIESTHPITAIMLYDAAKAGALAQRLLELGVYLVSFSYPVVPMGKARIRAQVSAAHSKEDLEQVLDCLRRAKEEMGL